MSDTLPVPGGPIVTDSLFSTAILTATLCSLFNELSLTSSFSDIFAVMDDREDWLIG